MFGDDVALFKSLLVRVLRDFADLAAPASIAPDDLQSRNKLRARAHKLKGSAGVIGATKVMQLAGAAEVALEEERPAGIVEEILNQPALALTTLQEETVSMLEKEPQTTTDTAAARAQSLNIRTADIDELLQLLESQNLAAIDKFALLAASLGKLVGAVRFERLREAIDNLEFELGADLLRQAPKPQDFHMVNAGHRGRLNT
jgi:HPt (histidine-containing phosphotransfer) domain-containing protein